MRLVFIASVVTLLLTSSAYGKTSAEKLKACLSGGLSESEQTLLIAEMADWKTVFSDYVKNNTAACFTKLTGKPSEFKNGQGLVLDDETIKIVTMNKEAAATALAAKTVADAKLAEEEARFIADLDALAEVSFTERERNKCELLGLRNELFKNQITLENEITNFKTTEKARQQEAVVETVIECQAWIREDKRSAITNPVCNKIFSELGLPDTQIDGPDIMKIISTETQLSTKNLELELVDIKLKSIKTEEDLVEQVGEKGLVKFKRQYNQELNAPAENTKSECELNWEQWLNK